MYVLFIHGPAAAGKHTIGSRLSEMLGIPLDSAVLSAKEAVAAIVDAVRERGLA